MNTGNRDSAARSHAARNKNLRIVLVVLLFGALPASWAIYNHFSPVTDTQYLQGTLESLHHGQSLVGSDSDNLFIRLENGALIVVAVPREKNVPFIRDAQVKVKMIARSSGKVTYSFEGFAK